MDQRPAGRRRRRRAAAASGAQLTVGAADPHVERERARAVGSRQRRRRRPDGRRPRASSFDCEDSRGGHPFDLAQLRRPAALRRSAGASGGVRCRRGGSTYWTIVCSAADLDVAVAAGAAVELARDAADQPGLVALFGEAAQAPALARAAPRGRPSATRLESQAKPAAIARLATPARRRPSLAPGRLTAGDSAQSASVAISVPRSQASAHQSRCSPRALGDRVGGGEGEPDRAAALEEVRGVGGGLARGRAPSASPRGRAIAPCRAPGRRRSCCGW